MRPRYRSGDGVGSCDATGVGAGRAGGFAATRSGDGVELTSISTSIKRAGMVRHYAEARWAAR
jgi:hypothetical protein